MAKIHKSKIDGAAVKYYVPKGWKKIKAGENIYLHGPKNKTGHSPVILISNTKINNTIFDFKALKVTQNQYFKNRLKYLKKKKEKLIKKIPFVYKKAKKKSWYEIGYIAKSPNKRREEVSRFMTCKNNLIQIKSMDFYKKKPKKRKYIKKMRNSVSCI